MDWKTAGTGAWAVLRWVFKAAIVAAVLLVLLVVVAGIHEYVDLEKLSTTGANAWLMALGLLVIGALLYFAFRALARLFLSPRSWQVFGADPVARLIALGIVTFFNPKAVFSLIVAPATVAVQLVSDLPKIIKRLAERDMPNTVALDLTLARAAWILENVGLELSRAVTRLFELLPIADVIVALALWAILGQLLSGATEGPPGKQGQLRVFAMLRNLSEPQRRIASLAVVFLVGIYFSTAAIVAIPWLQGDKGPQGFTRERLEKALEPLSPKASEQATALTPVSDTAADQFKSIERSLDDARKRVEADRSVKQIPLSASADMLGDLSRIVLDAKKDRDRAAEFRTQLRDDFIQRRSKVIGEALAVFDAETAVTMNSQERAFFFHDIQRSANEQVQDMERLLRECNRKILEVDKQFEFAAGELSSIFKRPEGTSTVAFGQAHSRLTGLGLAASSAIRACNQPSVGPLYVSARDPGAGWGPFAVVSQWLLRTRSQELALITGMFGFGLLGSAIVTFVRPHPADSAAKVMLGSIAGEVASIVARGLSAAIVVFLAVKGGLAIFSGRETEPNAYVLFFTCLVGAVFSEDVWGWARKKFGDQFPKQRGKVVAKGGTKPRPRTP